MSDVLFLSLVTSSVLPCNGWIETAHRRRYYATSQARQEFSSVDEKSLDERLFLSESDVRAPTLATLSGTATREHPGHTSLLGLQPHLVARTISSFVTICVEPHSWLVVLDYAIAYHSTRSVSQK